MSESNGSFDGSADAGLLLVGHGSREQVSLDEFLATAKGVASLAGRSPVEPCFLEFAQPTIADGLSALARRGARRIVVVPVLLFAAGHAKRDIPAAVAAAADYPDMSIAQSGHLGCHDAILELSKLRYDEAIAARPGSAEDTVLVMVGRGSHDLEATAEMRDFVQLRAAATPVGKAVACFVAMAEPRLAETLDEAVARAAKRIVVQPHLLFGGVLADRIARTVALYAGRFPNVDWVSTGHLGPSRQLVRAILSRAAETLSSLRV